MLKPLWIVVITHLPVAVLAQNTGNPAGLSPDTPGVEAAKPASDHANTQDKLFVRQATVGGRAEVELSTLAQRKATSPEIKQFAQRMIDDHRKSNDRLQRISRAWQPELPKDLDPEHQAVRKTLADTSGETLDAKYLASQIMDHQKTANLLQWHLSYGQNEQLLAYSAETLSVVMHHLQMARDLQARLMIMDQRQ
jgi:putative membrane protein